VILSDLGPLEPISDSLGHHIGEPVGLYSSFEGQAGYSYHVVSPDGTCVIGQERSCMVQGVALGSQSATVTLGGQNYTVEYTGPAAKTQRFAIESAQPILGAWKVQIESAGTVQEDVMSRVLLKIVYSPENLPSNLVSSR